MLLQPFLSELESSLVCRRPRASRGVHARHGNSEADVRLPLAKRCETAQLRHIKVSFEHGSRMSESASISAKPALVDVRVCSGVLMNSSSA